MTNLRVGFGYDVHQLAEGNKFVLGGVNIPFTKGPIAHSDGDVLIHALCDALLGAASLGDIGVHFPDTDPAYNGVDSKVLLRLVIEKLESRSFHVVNIDATVSLQRPKLKEYVPIMQKTLGKILKINSEDISIKATTTENLGFVGREEGIAAQSVVLIEKN